MNERQLHLFRGRRQKGVELPRISEFVLQCQVADALRNGCSPCWVWMHIPNGEKRDPVTAMRLKRMGVQPGVPDFAFFGPRNAVVWLELKRPGGGRISDAQNEMSIRLMGCGHKYYCTNDYAMALDLLRDEEIVRMRVSA